MKKQQMVHPPFFKSHDGWSFILENGLIRMHADQQFIAETTSLKHGARMTMVGKIKAAIYPYAVFADRYVLLRIHGPLTGGWDILRRVSKDDEEEVSQYSRQSY